MQPSLTEINASVVVGRDVVGAKLSKTSWNRKTWEDQRLISDIGDILDLDIWAKYNLILSETMRVFLNLGNVLGKLST